MKIIAQENSNKRKVWAGPPSTGPATLPLSGMDGANGIPLVQRRGRRGAVCAALFVYARGRGGGIGYPVR